MRDRSDLQTILVDVLGSSHVYFQPPPTVEMKYPCIVYQRDKRDTKFADNKPYSQAKRYMLTYIDPDPDSEIPDRIAELPYCLFDRFFTADNLNHDVYELFF